MLILFYIWHGKKKLTTHRRDLKAKYAILFTVCRKHNFSVIKDTFVLLV